MSDNPKSPSPPPKGNSNNSHLTDPTQAVTRACLGDTASLYNNVSSASTVSSLIGQNSLASEPYQTLQRSLHAPQLQSRASLPPEEINRLLSNLLLGMLPLFQNNLGNLQTSHNQQVGILAMSQNNQGNHQTSQHQHQTYKEGSNIEGGKERASESLKESQETEGEAVQKSEEVAKIGEHRVSGIDLCQNYQHQTSGTGAGCDGQGISAPEQTQEATNTSTVEASKHIEGAPVQLHETHQLQTSQVGAVKLDASSLGAVKGGQAGISTDSLPLIGLGAAGLGATLLNLMSSNTLNSLQRFVIPPHVERTSIVPPEIETRPRVMDVNIIRGTFFPDADLTIKSSISSLRSNSQPSTVVPRDFLPHKGFHSGQSPVDFKWAQERYHFASRLLNIEIDHENDKSQATPYQCRMNEMANLMCTTFDESLLSVYNILCPLLDQPLPCSKDKSFSRKMKHFGDLAIGGDQKMLQVSYFRRVDLLQRYAIFRCVADEKKEEIIDVIKRTLQARYNITIEHCYDKKDNKDNFVAKYVEERCKSINKHFFTNIESNARRQILP